MQYGAMPFKGLVYHDLHYSMISVDIAAIYVLNKHDSLFLFIIYIYNAYHKHWGYKSKFKRSVKWCAYSTIACPFFIFSKPR
jgi:hypothetical protein